MAEFLKPIDAKDFRQTIGMFATGVTVLVAEADGKRHGMTANAVSSLSLEPMLILVCLGKNAKMYDFVKKAGRFSMNILAADQEPISNHFAGVKSDNEPEFSFARWHDTLLLKGCVASLCCSVYDILEGGDHWIVIGEVQALHQSDQAHRPLLVYCGQYRNIKPKPIAPAPERFDMVKQMPQIFYDPWEDHP